MAMTQYPSTVTMPAADRPYPSILDFLEARFPQVSAETWQLRLEQGKLLRDDGQPIDAHSAYTPHRKILYFREADQEPQIPFTESILFHNEEILVACKPHFLPVTPSGPYVNECLLNRLRLQTGNPDLAPINRIDRETAGLVLFSVKKQNRGLYHDLFMHGRAEKTYHALCHAAEAHVPSEWLIENRIERGAPWFRMQTAPGAINSRTQIRLMEVIGPDPAAGGQRRARFHLSPLTGKKHQLRLHLSGLGFSIINDHLYPDLTPKEDDDYDNPLQLIAKTLRFIDPISGRKMEFHSERQLMF